MAASSPAAPPAWSVAVRLRHRGGLEIRASVENVRLPGWWGRGGERLSLLLRLRRRLVLAVTSHCAPRSPATPSNPPTGSKVIRFLRSGWARVPPVVWRWPGRKNRPQPTVRAASAAASCSRLSKQTIQRSGAWTPTAAATLWFAAAVLAVVLAAIAVFFLMGGRRRGEGCHCEPVAHCASWWCFLAHFLEPPSLRNYEWPLRLLKRSLKWLLLHN